MECAQSDRPYAGRFLDGEHRFTVRVYYEDTDAGGVVYHANFLRFFERARTDMLALAGADIAATLNAKEGGYVVAAADLRYLRPARLGEVLIILSRLVEVRQAACTIQQRVMRDDQMLVEGKLTVAFVGTDGRPKRQPTAWIEAFQGFNGAEQKT
ncbi:YbgC/FadM family acyl-CoA thioesterase [Sphingomonas crusticola]|uniref:YbgC/FadM family acyl-CoA thioesterase n=1 Tax=Sphingomonas crusticola TaxID=1697973 RepID=UPI000E2720C2|nr:YbgC/FadM family acyl-CoA thioesterase [Sphingomonas crusticola]